MNEIEKRAKAGKEVAEYSKKVDAERKRNGEITKRINKIVENGGDPSMSAIDLKYSSRNLERLEKDRQRALNKMK